MRIPHMVSVVTLVLALTVLPRLYGQGQSAPGTVNIEASADQEFDPHAFGS